jgi:hypothetical protein
MDFLNSVFDFIDKALFFISGLEISNRIEFAYRAIDLLYYYTFLRIIILIPILIFIGFLFVRYFLKTEESFKDDLIRLYAIFIFLFAFGLGGDIIIAVLGVLFILGNLYRLVSYYLRSKVEAQEKILEKLDEIKEKLK